MDQFHVANGAATMKISMEGATVEAAYDIFQSAGGAYTAVQLLSESAVVGDGVLNLAFEKVVYGARVSAIRIVRDGEIAISATTDDPLYHSERQEKKGSVPENNLRFSQGLTP